LPGAQRVGEGAGAGSSGGCGVVHEGRHASPWSALWVFVAGFLGLGRRRFS
jgi:MYXO-CTERM domain-containing protein